MYYLRTVVFLCLALCTATPAWSQDRADDFEMRTWKDPSGRFRQQASFVNADDDLVLLESKDELLVLSRKELSDADQEYVKTAVADSRKGKKKGDIVKTIEKDKNESLAKLGDFDSNWKLRGGEAVTGALLGFGTQVYVVNRERGEVFVDGREVAKTVPALRTIIPSVVGSLDNVKIPDMEQLEDHIAERGGGPLRYKAQGIQIAVRDNEMVTIPIELLSKDEMLDVAPGFRRWQAAQSESVDDTDRQASSKVERLLLESHGSYPTKRLLRRERQLRYLQLSLLASDVGVTNIWQIALHSGRPYTPPYGVVVPGENSRIAKQRALTKFPGWRVIGIRQLD